MTRPTIDAYRTAAEFRDYLCLLSEGCTLTNQEAWEQWCKRMAVANRAEVAAALRRIGVVVDGDAA